MSVAFPEIRVGEPVRHESLAVFPLFAPPSSEVDYQLSHEALGTEAFSGTSAMSDTFEAHRKRLDEFREKIQYVEGASGVAVTVRGKVVAIDLFDKPSTCQKVWNRLMSGFVLDAIESEQTEHRADVQDVARLLGNLGQLNWQQALAVGEGEEYRAESPAGDHASVLAVGDVLPHGSVVCQ
jgi:hypothetical protein